MSFGCPVCLPVTVTPTCENGWTRRCANSPGPWSTLNERIDMTERTCSVDGCDSPTRPRDRYCTMHRARWDAKRDLGPPGRIKAPDLAGRTIYEKLMLNHTVSPEGCWRWNGPTYRGYGQIRVSRTRTIGVHRAAYEAFIGPIPEGMSIDHVAAWGCVHKNCINPAHLEAVTSGENARRAQLLIPKSQRLKEFCKRGHRLELTARITKTGSRVCRECDRLRPARRKRGSA